jgi:ribosomal protein L24
MELKVGDRVEALPGTAYKGQQGEILEIKDDEARILFESMFTSSHSEGTLPITCIKKV